MKKTIRIPFEIKVNITNAVIKKLGVKDYFKLKDRLDGMFYLSKQCMRIYSSYCIQEIFKISLIDEKKPFTKYNPVLLPKPPPYADNVIDVPYGE